jgi:hypothetical protein
LENPAQYGSAIYTHDDAGLRVNLFIASTLDWPEKGMRIQQTTRFPEEAGTTLAIQTKQPVTMEIGIRIPAWCARGFQIAINGKVETCDAKPGSYALLRRTWKSGDRIACKLPMSFSKYPMPDNETQMAFLYGPLVMVGEGARPWLGELVGDPAAHDSWVNRLDSWFAPRAGAKLHFAARDGAGRTIRFKPYYQVGGGEFFTGYWDIVRTSAIVDDHNIALGKPTLCSTPDPSGCNVEAFLRSGKAVDGQYGGDDDWYVKWFPNGMAPQWITVDLEREYNISGTEWFPAVEDIKENLAYRYIIEASSDNRTWVVFDDQAANDMPGKSYPHTGSVKARYMRLTVLPRPELKDNQARPKIAEFKIFGTAGGVR